MFVPVQISLGAGGERTAEYDRAIELTARQMRAFSAETGDMLEPLTAVASDLHTMLEAQFASQGAAGASGRWRVLSEPYGAWKAKHAPGVPILVGLRPKTKRTRHSPRKPAQTYEVSGQMMRALLVPLGDRVTWQIDSKRMAYLPSSDIAGFHETGTEKMPARPPVAPTLEFLHSVDRQFVRWLAGVMKRTGL